MVNDQNFKSIIVLDKDPLVKDPTEVKVSTVPKTGSEPPKPVSLEIYTSNETKGITYLVLWSPSVFVQTLGEMCLDMEMMHLYEHFVLSGSNLLSQYWRDACEGHENRKEGNIWNNGSFAIITKEYKNQVLSSEHAVAAGDVFCSYLQWL